MLRVISMWNWVILL